jgi:tetratricopeptide (TPR) repeat protein
MKKIYLFCVAALLISSLAMAAGAADYYNAGVGSMNKGDYKKAFSYFNYAAKLEPKNPANYEKIGECYEKAGNKAMAAKYYKYAQSLKNSGTSGAASGNKDTSKINVSAFAGFTTVSMSKLNKKFEDLMNGNIAYYQNSYGYTASGKAGKFGSGFLIGVDGGYTLMPGLSAGLRIEDIMATSSKSSFSYAYYSTFYSYSYSSSYEISGNIIPILVGVSYSYNIINIPLSIGGGLYAGYGFAGLTEKDSGSSSNSISYTGGTFVVDINADALYKINSMLSAGLKLGYRLANVSKMSYNSTPLMDSQGNNVEVDFGGIVIAADLKFSF